MPPRTGALPLAQVARNQANCAISSGARRFPRSSEARRARQFRPDSAIAGALKMLGLTAEHCSHRPAADRQYETRYAGRERGPELFAESLSGLGFYIGSEQQRPDRER
jgi:hypothetical protein